MYRLPTDPSPRKGLNGGRAGGGDGGVIKGDSSLEVLPWNDGLTGIGARSEGDPSRDVTPAVNVLAGFGKVEREALCVRFKTTDNESGHKSVKITGKQTFAHPQHLQSSLWVFPFDSG